MPLSVVVPVYNSEQSLSTLAELLEATLGPTGLLGELILVNDGSRDASWEAVCALAARYPWVRGIDLMRNFGQHNALLCGIRAARFETIVTMDDDLQTPPEELPAMLAEYEKGFDVVYGTPRRQGHGLLRNLASSVTKAVLQGAMGAQTARCVSAYRVFRTQLRDAFSDYSGPYVSIDVLLTWGARRFSAVPVRSDPRRFGTTNYTVSKLIAHALNLMTGFSTLPLQLASLLGFALTLFGVAVFGYVVAVFVIKGRAVPGFAFLASLIAIFSGAQLLVLGVMGEYLARMHFRMMERPAYKVARATSSVDATRP